MMLSILLATASLLGSAQDPRTCANAIGADEQFMIDCAYAIEADRIAREEALGGYDEYGRWDPMYNATVDRNLNIVPRAVRRVPPRRPDAFADPLASISLPEMTREGLEMTPEEFLRAQGVDVSPRYATPDAPAGESWGAIAFTMAGFGYAERASSQAEAEQTAIVDCERRSGTACAAEDVIAVPEACLAVAQGRSGFGFALGAEQRSTGRDAVSDCDSRDSDCRVVYSGCSFSRAGL